MGSLASLAKSLSDRLSLTIFNPIRTDTPPDRAEHRGSQLAATWLDSIAAKGIRRTF